MSKIDFSFYLFIAVNGNQMFRKIGVPLKIFLPPFRMYYIAKDCWRATKMNIIKIVNVKKRREFVCHSAYTFTKKISGLTLMTN